MTKLPNNLSNLNLNLSYNDLTANILNMKYIQIAIKQLPNHLHNLQLNLHYNNLGDNPDNLILLIEGIK